MSEQVTDTTHDDAEVTTEHPDDEEAVDTAHLDDMDDGCGCAEVWEHLSENRDD
ncbi:hypothetical protein [Halorientalis salina]|uniref:hypothetical protein n=1 Tax=Halorientalis salina TaxID=2932266 RepID=UPI00145CE598|nr:hypothetical protein [Halorientalis salina]